MATKIIEYTASKLFTEFPVSDAFVLIDNRILALTIFLLGLAVYGYLYIRTKETNATLHNKVALEKIDCEKWGWLGSLLLALGAFSYSYGLTDEVFVNLVHPLNLINHGIFSFDPETKVDGTVEPLFYLMHVFGGTRQGIITFNFVFSYTLFIFTAYLIDVYFSGSQNRIYIRNLYLLFPPVLYAVSGGFGAVWINFLFILGLLCVKQGNLRTFCIALILLGLSRPEALAYDAVLIVVWFIYQRQCLLPLLSTIASVTLFYVFYRYYYGHWVPTPLYFKAYPSDCPPYIFTLWIRGFFTFLFGIYDNNAPIHSFFIKHHINALFYGFRILWAFIICSTIFVGIVVFVKAIGEFFSQSQRPNKNYIFPIALILMLPILAIYTNPPGTLGGNSRYYIVLMSMVYLTLISVFDLNIIPQLEVSKRNSLNKALFVTLGVFSIYLFLSVRIQILYNRNLDANVGTFFHDLPPEFTLATSELNTFGYFSDRTIVDLWGYTNTNLSRSGLYSIGQGGGRRVNPNHFLDVSPAIAYNMAASSKIDWSNSRKISQEHGDKANYDYSIANIIRNPVKSRRDEAKGFVFPKEPGWLLDNLAMPIYYGNPGNLYAKYDVVFIHDRKVMFAFILRKDLVDSFNKWALQKGLTLQEIRQTDHIPNMKIDDLGLSKEPSCRLYLESFNFFW